MPSRARVRLAAVGVTTAAALALPLAAVADDGTRPAPATVPVGASWTADDPTALSRAVLAAAQQARELAAAPDASTLAEPEARGPKPGTPPKPAPPKPTPPKPGKPPQPTPDPVRDALDAAVRATVDDGAVAVTARVDTPTLRWSQAAGVRELGRRAPARTTDRFEVASITKPMVATLVLQEVERGTWTLGTRVEDVLPGLLPGHHDVTIEHLLSHRSGMPTGTDSLLLARIADPESIDEFVAAIGQDYSDADHVAAALATPWLFEPGTGWSYSNSGYVVLGMLLEEVTGTDLAHLLRHRVFRPAGMRHSEFPDEPDARGPRLVGAAYTGDQGAGWYSLGHFDPDVFGAAGAVRSTTADLLAFGDGLVDGRLLSRATVADMATPRSTEVLEYGLGVYRLPDPCAPPEAPAYLYGHDGGSYGTISITLTSPDGARSVAVGVTGRDLSGAPEPLYDVSALLVPMLLATC